MEQHEGTTIRVCPLTIFIFMLFGVFSNALSIDPSASSFGFIRSLGCSWAGLCLQLGKSCLSVTEKPSKSIFTLIGRPFDSGLVFGLRMDISALRPLPHVRLSLVLPPPQQILPEQHVPHIWLIPTKFVKICLQTPRRGDPPLPSLLITHPAFCSHLPRIGFLFCHGILPVKILLIQIKVLVPVRMPHRLGHALSQYPSSPDCQLDPCVGNRILNSLSCILSGLFGGLHSLQIAAIIRCLFSRINSNAPCPSDHIARWGYLRLISKQRPNIK